MMACSECCGGFSFLPTIDIEEYRLDSLSEAWYLSVKRNRYRYIKISLVGFCERFILVWRVFITQNQSHAIGEDGLRLSR